MLAAKSRPLPRPRPAPGARPALLGSGGAAAPAARAPRPRPTPSRAEGVFSAAEARPAIVASALAERACPVPGVEGALVPPRPARVPRPRPSALQAPGAPHQVARVRASLDFLDERKVGSAAAMVEWVPGDGPGDPIRPDDLEALAQLGLQYLDSGAEQLARLILEGLCVLGPKQAFLQMALGLCLDRLGDTASARTAYQRASELEPKEARADLNLAELSLEADDRRTAQAYLARAIRKAQQSRDRPALEKAQALLANLTGDRS